ncbi:hypothetical protein BCE_2284 [Bacillus cereus ATCC 10987]|uniref:Uncharacterized protein n=1 Tax=Bacillus cereus (strain ATCC 10987 / NRS 248) TaxID=222523 RepID=Q738V9_BACC1|nr:hypothetical protein BCE_2284 [Bacillus cereus ATCC 10987]
MSSFHLFPLLYFMIILIVQLMHTQKKEFSVF